MHLRCRGPACGLARRSAPLRQDHLACGPKQPPCPTHPPPPAPSLLTPAEAMRSLLQYLKAQYGGVAQYMSYIGFGPDKQERLRELLVR